MNKRHAGFSALIALALLSGCSDINQFMGKEEPIDYKSAVAQQHTDPLSIPPDLTQAANDPRYRAPEGATTYSQYQQQGQQAAAATTQVQNSNVLPQRSDMQVKRDGDIRWLVVDLPPEQIFSKVVDFWTSTGFTVQSNNPKAGLIETDWAENRAKIPESWLRQALGSVLDQVYDSGEREKFRTRIERVDGHSEIYINHQQMLEKSVGPDGSQVRWDNGKEDPGLNAAMLARLMVYLGTDVDRAKTLVATAENAPQKPTVRDVTSNGAMLNISESFDRAWRRVGVALDSGGFTVDDRDRSAGDYFVRYLDTDTGLKQDDPGFLSRIFSSDKKTQAPQFRVHVADVGGGASQVTVLDTNGQRDNSPTAQRMLSVLADKM